MKKKIANPKNLPAPAAKRSVAAPRAARAVPAAAVVVAEPKPLAVRALGELEERAEAPAAERINYHVAMGQHHGRLALAHLLAAGWELAKQKQAIGWGGWAAWCDKNLDISNDTADRYVQFYAKTIGSARAAASIPLDRRLTHRELAAATVGMDGKSATRAMVDLGIIRRASWGGTRAGAGRKPKGADVAAALDAVAHAEPILWAAAKGALDSLVQLSCERDYLHRLADDHLAEVSRTLAELSDAAARVLAERIGGAR